MENGSVQSISQVVQGKLASYAVGSLVIPVQILDARKVWGRVDCLITPIGGHGEQWVEASKINMRRD